MLMSAAGGLLAMIGAGLWAQAPAPAPAKPTAGVLVAYTAEQSAQGKMAYDESCGSCHGSTTDNGQFGPALRGATFNMSWAGGTVGDECRSIAETIEILP